MSAPPLFRFVDGPITANNPMGVHHAWGRTLKDVFLRYKALTGHSAKCYVDDQLINEGAERPTPVGTPIFANASFVKDSHEVIVKVVNFGNDPVDATLNLHGGGSLTSQGKAIILTGDPKDVNSVEEPTKVAPKEQSITTAGSTFQWNFPPHSLTLMRLTASP